MSGFGYNVLGFGANAAGGGADLPSDDEFNRTSFLSHFDGANNGVNNAFDDASANNYTITATGNVTQGSFGPFARPDGEWGVSFDGNGDYLSAEDDTNFSFGTGDFTIECWLFQKNNSSTFNDIMGTANNNVLVGSNRGGWVLAYYHNYSVGSLYAVKFGYQYNNSFPVNIAFTKTLNTNTWYHLAITRQGNQLKCFVDGTQTGSTTTNSTDMISTEPLTVGTGSGGGQTYFPGSISNVRVVKGTAVYTSNFTPPTSPLTAITNTKLLTCQSNRLVDNSASALTVTPSGNTTVTAFGPILTSSVYNAAVNGGSAYFDGSGDYLSTPSVSIGTGTFSFECWVYPIGITDGNNDNIVRFAEGNGSTGVQIYITNSSSLRIYKYSGGYTTFSNVFLPNQWYKLLFVRESNTLTTYVNGVSVGTYTVSDNLDGVVRLGANGTGELLTGYMSGARLSNNARQSGNYTVETAPFTTDDNTTFLLNMADAQAIDSAAQNNLTLFGTAKLSTGQAKFGNTSLLLDGNSDYATFLENGGNNIDGGGNWTFEFFWRFVNKTSPSTQEIITKGIGLQIYTIDGSLGFALSSDNSGTYFINIRNGTTLDNDTWYHLALVKNGTSYKLYLNGTSDLSATSSSNIDTGGYPWFLGTLSGAESTYISNGYMDEVRISQFARYTANFTAPTEPFADKGQ